MNMPNLAACHHCMRCARVCSCIVAAGGAACAEARALGIPSMAREAPVVFSKSRRVRFLSILLLGFAAMAEVVVFHLAHGLFSFRSWIVS